jgi:transketolase
MKQVINMLSKKRQKELEIFAAQIRKETLKSVASFGMGHLGGAMSMVETMAVLYGEEMNIDPKNPKMEDRDRFVLSKGHAGPSLYATLALKGYFPVEELLTLNQNGTRLPSHCDMTKTPGIDMSTGSLGQGISVAIGMAMAARILGKSYYTYVMIGDGECDEGQVWEGFLCAAHHKVDNLIAFIDYNKLQLDGATVDICDLGCLADKLIDFNWHTQQVDGHSVSEIYDAIQKAKTHKGQPSVIILDTEKGKGCKMVEEAEMKHAIRISQEQQEQVNDELESMTRIIEELEEERCGIK